MRLISTKAAVPYIDQIDREPHTEDTAPTPNMVGKANPEGAPMPGATTFYFRSLTQAEEGALTDSMFDMGRSTVKADDDGSNAKVDMAMSISPSKNKRQRVQLAMTSFDELYGPETNTKGKPVELAYEAEDMVIGGQKFTGAPGAVLDMIPQDVLTRMERFVRGLSRVEPGTGKT